MHERAGEARARLLAERQVAEELAHQRTELEALDQLVHRGTGRAVEPGVDAQVLLDGEPPVHQRFGRSEAHAAERGLAARARLLAEERHRARRRQDQAEQDVERRGLAGAVGAEEADDLAPLHRERQPCQRERARKLLAQIAHLDRKRARSAG